METDSIGWLNIARTLLWETKLDDAEKVYEPEKETNVKAAMGIAEIEVLRGLLTEDPNICDLAFERLSHVEQLAQQISSPPKSYTQFFKFRSSSPTSPQIDLTLQKYSNALLGEIYLMMAGVHFRRGGFIKGAFNIRKSWKCYESNRNFLKSETSKDPDTESCIQFGIGLFYFFVSLVPVKFLWIIEAIGFQADREEGIKQLTECYKGGGYRAPLALVLLIWINRFFLEDMNESERLLKEAETKYPKGALFHYLGGYYYRKKGQLDQAVSSFQRTFECSAQLRQLQIASYYESGWTYFLKEDWKVASEFFEKFLETNKTPSFRAFCGYQLGGCYELLNQTDKALKVFEKVPGWVRKHFTYDQFASRKSKEFVKNGGMKKLDKLLLVVAVQLEGVKPAKALETLENIASEFQGCDLITNEKTFDIEYSAQFMYYKGLALRGKGDTNKAKQYLTKVVDLESEIRNEIYLIPHSLCEIGEMYFEEDNLSQAKKILSKAKAYSDYDFDKPLIRRLESLIDKIKKALKSGVTQSRMSFIKSDSNPDLAPPVVSTQTEEVKTADESDEEFFTASDKSDAESVDENLNEKEVEIFPTKESKEEIEVVSNPTPEAMQALESQFGNATLNNSSPLVKLSDVNDSSIPENDRYKNKQEYLHQLDELVLKMRDKTKGIPIKTRIWRVFIYSKCFIGEEAVDWLAKNLCLQSREEAISIGVKLMEFKFIHHVAKSQPFRDGYFFYRFQEDEEAPALNVHRIWTLPPRPVRVVIEELVGSMGQLFEEYLSEDGKQLDMRLSISKEFRNFTLATCELQSINLNSLNEKEKLVLFINVYNMLVIHATVVNGPPLSALQRRSFFVNSKYQIGNDIFTLDDIEHGILRGNKHAPGSFSRQFSATDPRKNHVIQKMDKRIHFALNCGAKSCPPLRNFSFEKIENELNFAAETFIDEDLEIDKEKKQITISKIFDWYISDFGGKEKQMLNSFLPFMEKQKRRDLEELLEDKFTLKYKQYDWTTMYLQINQ